MPLLVTQPEVDALASFVEACGELEKEPFFGKDEKCTFQGDGQDRWTFNLGDRFHFRSALVSFRRLWMPREPSSWKNVVAILQRDGMPEEIIVSSKRHFALIEQESEREDHLLQFKLAGHRVIDLWLNTVFAHGGIEGKNKRREFEAISDRYGQALFEYTFRILVLSIGKLCCSLSAQGVVPSLEMIKKDCALVPTFRIGAAFGVKRKEKTREGHTIIRQGSSAYFSEETFEERFERILARFNDLSYILKHVGRDSAEIWRATLKAEAFAALLEALDGRLEIVEQPPPTEASIISGFSACFWVRPPTPDLRARLNWKTAPHALVNISREAVVVTTAFGQQLLDDQWQDFRHDLLHED
jgi:hypothetical protein